MNDISNVTDEEIIEYYSKTMTYEQLEKELKSFKNGSVCYPSEPVKYTEGITDTLEKQITHITNQIRELEG